MKWRNSKERELLASGGSRDQTLPNKNNPNPDLSDAKGDRQASLSPPSSPALLMEQGSQQRSGNSAKNPLEQKFISLNKKYDLMSSPPSSKSSTHSNEFKYEADDGNGRSAQPPAIGQLFNSFYDNQSSDGSVKTFNNQNGGKIYYDEYDSNSDDSDEEINVT
jgi:hypothetical protein